MEPQNGVNASNTSEEIGPKDVSRVKGVPVNCDADQNIFGVKKYVAVEVDRIFTESITPSSIAERLEFPVITRRYPYNPAWDTYSNYSQNQAITLLHMNADPNSRAVMGFGWAPMEWQNRVGSVLVIHQDGKDLSPYRCEALCHFCQFKLRPLFRDNADLWEDDWDNPMRKEPAFQQMTKNGFQGYFEDFRGSRLKENPSWVDAKSPYVD